MNLYLLYKDGKLPLDALCSTNNELENNINRVLHYQNDEFKAFDWISCAFTWRYTLQGHVWWSRIGAPLDDKIKLLTHVLDDIPELSKEDVL